VPRFRYFSRPEISDVCCAMQDILDPRISPRKLGALSTEAVRLAREARMALGRYGVPTAIFFDGTGDLFAHPAAYASGVAATELVGVYSPGVGEAEIAQAIRVAAAARRAAIGIGDTESGSYRTSD
jgi:hypothetical protein